MNIAEIIGGHFNSRVNAWLERILIFRNNRNDEKFGFFCIQM